MKRILNRNEEKKKQNAMPKLILCGHAFENATKSREEEKKKTIRNIILFFGLTSHRDH